MKDKIMIIGFCFILSFFFLYSLLDTDMSISFSERRKLQTLPKIEVSSLQDGEYFKNLNQYLIDQFPLRDSLRRTKIYFLQNVYQQKLSHSAYIREDGIYQLEPTINENSLQYFSDKLNTVAATYFPKKKVYYAIIPDKNYYIESNSFPKLEYSKFYQRVSELLSPNFKEIDLKEALNLDAYYQTDLHWRQEKLEKVVHVLQSNLGLKKTKFPTQTTVHRPFYGAYYSKGGGIVKPDTLKYLTSNTIKNTKVYNYEKKKVEAVYEEEHLKNVDAYDVFLSGATPLLFLENKNASTNKELILFRDSFGSSLAPLLLENYRRITLIDLRYFSSKLLGEIKEIDFTRENQDILFLYSIPIVNQSFTLK